MAAAPLGVAGGDEIDIQFGSARIAIPVSRLAEAWRSRLLAGWRPAGGSLCSADAGLRADASAGADAHRGDDRILLESHATAAQGSTMERGGHLLVGGASGRRKRRAALRWPRFDPAPPTREQDVPGQRARAPRAPPTRRSRSRAASSWRPSRDATGVGRGRRRRRPGEHRRDREDEEEAGSHQPDASRARPGRRRVRVVRGAGSSASPGCGWSWVTRDVRQAAARPLVESVDLLEAVGWHHRLDRQCRTPRPPPGRTVCRR